MAATAAAGISAHYLGWKPTAGTRGDQFVDPIVGHLLDRALRWPYKLKRHWLQISDTSLRIGEFACDDGRSSAGQGAVAAACYQYPAIPLGDIGYVKIDPNDQLAFGLILLGYNEESTCSVHVHAWRGSSPVDVANFVTRLALAIDPGQQPDKYCRHPHQLQHQQSPVAAPAAASEASLGSLAHSVAQELRQRLDGRDSAPLLHPPRDYDTIRRSHGNVRLRCSEQLATSSQAPNGAYIRRQSVICAAARVEEHGSDYADCADPDEPPADYDTDPVGNSGGRNNSSASGASSSSLSLGEDSRWSDPWLGFSTWRQ